MTATPQTKSSYEWTHSETIGLANAKCRKCEGTGLMPGMHRTGKEPCNCVLRNIFRACLRRYIACVDDSSAYVSHVKLQRCDGVDASGTWERAAENYAADFYLIAKRTLDEDEFQIFRFHFLLGADWKLCCRRLGTERSLFFHSVYRIEQKMGRAYREVHPYSLFPTDEYFRGTMRKSSSAPEALPTLPKNILRPPVRLKPKPKPDALIRKLAAMTKADRAAYTREMLEEAA